jgi:uncharacterized protein YijF (DUF1287 family)
MRISHFMVKSVLCFPIKRGVDHSRISLILHFFSKKHKAAAVGGRLTAVRPGDTMIKKYLQKGE